MCLSILAPLRTQADLKLILHLLHQLLLVLKADPNLILPKVALMSLSAVSSPALQPHNGVTSPQRSQPVPQSSQASPTNYLLQPLASIAPPMSHI